MIRSLRRCGWDGWTRTSGCGSQSPLPYHLATPQCGKKQGTGVNPDPLPLSGVGDGTRTHNARNHNPVLCQLNYTHHI